MTTISRRRMSFPLLALAVGAVGCNVAMIAGLPLAGPTATSLACVMLLLFGLPHGTLDLELIKTRASGPATGIASLLAIYLGLAAAMFCLWQAAPVLALLSFIVVATVHFSEDWEGAGSRFLETGMALSLLSAPTLMHRGALDEIFVALTGRAEATVITDILTLAMPVAIMVGIAAMVALWITGQRVKASAGAVSLASMIVFPPIVGFALFFCLFHSPRHLAESFRGVDLSLRKAGFRVVLPLTAAAAGIAAAIYGLNLRTDVAAGLIASSFTTLSILTVPHMAAPMLVSFLSRANAVGPTRVGDLIEESAAQVRR